MDIKWYPENGKNDLRGAPKLIKPTVSSAQVKFGAPRKSK